MIIIVCLSVCLSVTSVRIDFRLGMMLVLDIPHFLLFSNFSESVGPGHKTKNLQKFQ